MEAFRAKSDLGVSLIRNDGVHPTDTTDTADPNNGAFVWTDAVWTIWTPSGWLRRRRIPDRLAQRPGSLSVNYAAG